MREAPAADAQPCCVSRLAGSGLPETNAEGVVRRDGGDDRSARLLGAILANASVALFIMDERQHCAYMNPAAEELTGWRLDEVRGRPLHDVVHHTRPDGAPYPLAECPIDRAFPERMRMQGEEVFVHRDGSFYPVAYTASPLREPDGRVTGTVVEVRPLARERAAEAAALAAHRRAEEVLDTIGEGFVSLDREFRVLAVNREGLRVDGRDREQILGRTHWEVWPGSVGTPVEAAYRKAMAERVPVELVHRYVSDVHDVWLDIRAWPTATGIAVAYRDVTARMQAEAALRESEARYRLLVESTSDMVFHLALRSPMRLSLPPEHQVDRIFAEAAFTFVNDAQAQAFGYAGAAEMIGRRLAEVLPRTPENERMVHAFVVAGHRIENARTEERDREGRRRVMLNTIVGRVADGCVHDWAGTARDITREVEAETALRDSEARHRLAVKAFQGAIYEYDTEADRAVRSGAFRELVGLAPDEIPPGRNGWFALVHPDDVGRIREAFERLVSGAADRVESEYRVRHRDGHWVHCWQRSLALRDGSGRLVRTVGSIVDISARVAAEAALRESEERFRSFAENAPDVIYILDAVERRLEYVSPAFERVWGEPRDLILADYGRWLALLHPADRDRVVTSMRAACARGETCAVEYRILRPSDVTVRHVRDTAVPLCDGYGRVLRVIGIVNDITDRKIAEGHRELLIRELNHRVKNTLATVQSIAAQTLRSGCEEPVRKAFEERLISLARAHDLLTRRNWEGIGLAEVAQEALRPHLGVAPAADVTAGAPGVPARIAIEGPDLGLTPKAALAFSMAFHELATNAAKHGALSVPSGRVTLRWRLDDSALRLSWTERGGPAVKAPRRRGFGSRLLERGLPHELNGALAMHYEPEGLRCEVEAPLGALVPPAEGV